MPDEHPHPGPDYCRIHDIYNCPFNHEPPEKK